MESSNKTNTWFGESRRWLANKDHTFQTWERSPPKPVEYWDVDPDPNYVEVEADPVQESNLSSEEHLPVYPIHQVRLIRADGDGDNCNDHNPILPDFWWILGYMALTALTAVGIRQSIK